MRKAFLSMFSGGLIGKILGFLREILLAALYGTSTIAASYRASQTAILIPINFFTNDALNAGFLPLYSRYKRENKERAYIFFWTIGSALFFLSLVLSFFLFLYMDSWVRLLFPGFTEEALKLTIDFIRVMIISIPFYIIVNMFSYLEMANGGYTLTSVRASVQNIGLIIGTITAYLFKLPLLMAWGFTSSYILLLVFGLYKLHKENLLLLPSKIALIELKSVTSDFWKNIRFLLILPFFLQGNIAIERAVASLIGVEVVAALDYAKVISETGILLLAVPLGLASLSELSDKSNEYVQEMLKRIIPFLLIITIPLSSFMMADSYNILSLIYARGNFDTISLSMTAPILLGISIGFWAQIIGYVLLKVLNSQMRNKEVLYIMVISLGLNSLFDLIFYKYLGPLTLGIGISIYGFFLFALAIFSLHLWKVILKPFVILLFGSLLYYLFSTFFSFQGLVGFLLSLLLFVIYWLLYILFFPSLRLLLASHMKELLYYLKRRKGGKENET